jgi:hypothetical protein
MGWAGFLSMALFHFPLFVTRKISFYKLMGSGRNGTFDIRPDWNQWALFTCFPTQSPAAPVTKELEGIPAFIQHYWHFCRVTSTTFVLVPIEGHGKWDGKEIFGNLPKQTDYEGVIAVLTRATIRLKRLRRFWQHVSAVAAQMKQAPGFITSYGVGEAPWIRQGTFSIWRSKEAMRQFAYQLPEHAAVIRKTRQEQWYSEDLFVRFCILSIFPASLRHEIFIDSDK